MSDALDKAEAAAAEAAVNTAAVQIALAAVELAKTAAAQQQAAAQPSAPARPEFDARKWLVVGGVVVSIGLVAALFAVAIAIGATCATACLLVLRSMWRDIQRGK